MHKDILQVEEKLSGLRAALADFEARRSASQEMILKEREALATANAELFELRVQSKLDSSVSGSIPSRQRAAEKRREAIEDAEISEIAYGRKIDELRREIATTEDVLKKTRNAVILRKVQRLRDEYAAAAEAAVKHFEGLSVAVSQLTLDGGKSDLKAAFPELLHFPQVMHGNEIMPGAPCFISLETGKDGLLRRVFPNFMDKARKGEVLAELLK